MGLGRTWAHWPALHNIRVNSVHPAGASTPTVINDAAAAAAGTPSEKARDRAREARFAERRQARQAHDKARQRYQGLTKAELSDQLARRQLPKSGNVDELIERLAQADTN